jgi:hypothetical protein
LGPVHAYVVPDTVEAVKLKVAPAQIGPLLPAVGGKGPDATTWPVSVSLPLTEELLMAEVVVKSIIKVATPPLILIVPVIVGKEPVLVKLRVPLPLESPLIVYEAKPSVIYGTFAKVKAWLETETYGFCEPGALWMTPTPVPVAFALSRPKAQDQLKL